MQTAECRRILSALLFGVLSGAGEAAQGADFGTGEPDGRGGGAWLNVGDLGVSGSSFETTVATVADSRQITVAKVGDFRVGQGITLSRCNPHFEHCVLKPPDNPYGTDPLGDAAELRGYDGAAGGWLVLLVEINGVDPLTVRWSDDMARTWKGTKIPVTFDWQPLSGGVEIRLKRQVWRPGHMITFNARDHLVTTIEKIDGDVLTLRDAAARSVKDAVLRHCDGEGLQAVVTRAIREKCNVYFPAGHYRLMAGLAVTNPSGTVLEGAGGADTTLDISEGFGPCIRLSGGTEATVRNLRMVGHTGLGDGPGWHSFQTSGGKACWPVGLKPCSAMHIRNTERVLVENCHASKMNCEAFYCQGSSRSGTNEPPVYTKSLTYLRCSATDCDGNGFNNNDLAENTSVLHCRIVDVGGCTWEGASRFVRFIGNYVRNSGTVAMGNIRSRAAHLEQLGSGQHIVADNVFEGRTFYNGRAGGYIVRATDGATQVIVRNNLFVNYNSSAIEMIAGGDGRSLPTGNCTITGNILDMTAVGEPSRTRTAIHVGASDVVIADNQIYVRGGCDTNVTAIRLTEPAINLIAHDNLLRDCGAGITSDTAYSVVGEIVDGRTFSAGRGAVPFERRQSHRYRGWNVAWFRGTKPDGLSVIESFDPETLRFNLREPREMRVGDRFEVFPASANWNLHDNMIVGCQYPVMTNSHGGATCHFEDNVIGNHEGAGGRP
ncbi:MAG TPA: hypothetical protein PLU30_01100 [Verrucomicrobiae bacterium]|nr:hypothetical protein [Verrucomicrobiae bacterium]